MKTAAPPSTARRIFNGLRIRVKRDDKWTQVSYNADETAKALKFAGNIDHLRRTVRDVVLETAEAPSRKYSEKVRAKVLARLRGAYRPNRVEDYADLARLPEADLASLDAALAAENNSAWETA